MRKGKQPLEHLPFSESTFYILLALVEPMHGYGVMQNTEEISRGMVKLGPGTLYGAFATLQEQGLITMVREENRRKVYQLTGNGREALQAQIRRYEVMLENARQMLSMQSPGADKDHGRTYDNE